MKGISIIGISRGSEYSPNHVDNDAAIFSLAVEELRNLGCKVDIYSESEFVSKKIEGEIIFDMARDTATIRRLKELENKGALIVNSAYGVENCIRKPMTELLLSHKVPYPHSIIVQTDETYQGDFYPCWLKRGNSHAIVKEDVSYATNRQEAETILTNFRKRGIPEAVINEHLQGDLIKFYGVQGTDFFYWFYPEPCSHSKFGLEKINGKAKGIPFKVEDLKNYSNRAAEVLNVPIYGGDCIVLSNGEIKIIDFNDWPSFARCRNEAGKYIAECIYKQALKKLEK